MELPRVTKGLPKHPPRPPGAARVDKEVVLQRMVFGTSEASLPTERVLSPCGCDGPCLSALADCFMRPLDMPHEPRDEFGRSEAEFQKLQQGGLQFVTDEDFDGHDAVRKACSLIPTCCKWSSPILNETHWLQMENALRWSDSSPVLPRPCQVDLIVKTDQGALSCRLQGMQVTTGVGGLEEEELLTLGHQRPWRRAICWTASGAWHALLKTAFFLRKSGRQSARGVAEKDCTLDKIGYATSRGCISCELPCCHLCA
eukprot:Skav236263  [mRNA]  locus=scaffold829:645243:647350:- [translate_table: standard]